MLSLIVVMVVAAPPPAFDRKAWLNDFKVLEYSLERGYSHLEWFASPDSGVDLPALHKNALKALEGAKSDAEASFAITSFVDAFHDGHLVRKPSAVDGGLAPTTNIAEPEKPTTSTRRPPAPRSVTSRRVVCSSLCRSNH